MNIEPHQDTVVCQELWKIHKRYRVTVVKVRIAVVPLLHWKVIHSVVHL